MTVNAFSKKKFNSKQISGSHRSRIAMNQQQRNQIYKLDDKNSNDRFIFALVILIGKHVSVERMDGSKFVGVLLEKSISGGKFRDVILGCARMVYPEYQSTVHDVHRFTWLEVKEITVINSEITEQIKKLIKERDMKGYGIRGFMTDSDISKTAARPGNDRELTSVDASYIRDGDKIVDMDQKVEKWDQFETNQRLFGVKSTFDENFYTTKLDNSKATSEELSNAKALAHAIRRKPTDNIHLSEERGHTISHDIDEEERFSSILSDPKGGYVPPHRRISTGSRSAKTSPEFFLGKNPLELPGRKDPSEKLNDPKSNGISWAARVKGSTLDIMKSEESASKQKSDLISTVSMVSRNPNEHQQSRMNDDLKHRKKEEPDSQVSMESSDCVEKGVSKSSDAILVFGSNAESGKEASPPISTTSLKNANDNVTNTEDVASKKLESIGTNLRTSAIPWTPNVNAKEFIPGSSEMVYVPAPQVPMAGYQDLANIPVVMQNYTAPYLMYVPYPMMPMHPMVPGMMTRIPGNSHIEERQLPNNQGKPY